MKRFYVILGFIIALFSAVVLYLIFGNNIYVHVSNFSSTSKFEIIAYPLGDKVPAPIVLVSDSIELARTTNDEAKWGLRLDRNKNYLIKIKKDDNEFIEQECKIELFALIHISVTESKSDSFINCQSYSHFWDLGFIVGAE